jgi:protein subunit release factor A
MSDIRKDYCPPVSGGQSVNTTYWPCAHPRFSGPVACAPGTRSRSSKTSIKALAVLFRVYDMELAKKNEADAFGAQKHDYGGDCSGQKICTYNYPQGRHGPPHWLHGVHLASVMEGHHDFVEQLRLAEAPSACKKA